jgi:hypothetical protein
MMVTMSPKSKDHAENAIQVHGILSESIDLTGFCMQDARWSTMMGHNKEIDVAVENVLENPQRAFRW